MPKIPSDPHRSHGIPQLKLSTLPGAEPAIANRSVGSTSTSSKMWSVVGFYRDDEGLKEPILTPGTTSLTAGDNPVSVGKLPC